MNKQFIIISKLFCLIFVLTGLITASQANAQSIPEPIHQWNFDQPLKADTLQPSVGHLQANIIRSQSAGDVALKHVPGDEGNPSYWNFKGTKDNYAYLSMGNDPEAMKVPAETFTIEAWVKVNVFTEWGGIFGLIQDNGDFERGWLLGFRKDHFCFGLATVNHPKIQYLTSPQFIEPDTWYHVVGVYDGKQQILYVDGKRHAVYAKQSGPVFYPPKGELVIGGYVDENEKYPLNGAVERASIYAKALDANQVKALFDARKERFPGIIPTKPKVTDWPTWMRDNERTGLSDDAIQFPLKQRWVRHEAHPPTPAWPAPALRDFWNKKNHHPRVIYDRAFHLVGANDRLYFGSSTNDRLNCLDLKTGKLLWSFYTEGPIRLAPTITQDKIMFGSDDGNIYCLRAEDGRLIWKKNPTGKIRRIPGNERVISVWPVRSGVLVQDDLAYFCAGLFPKQGAYQYAYNILSGTEAGSTELDISPQGYLKSRGSRLYTASGRAPDAFLKRLERRGKAFSDDIRDFATKYPFALVGAGKFRFAGGENVVAGFNADTGEKVWETKVEGRPYAMAVVDHQLLVSTDKGVIYCFDGTGTFAGDTREIRSTFTKQDISAEAKQQTRDILKRTNTDLGYGLVINPDGIDMLVGLAEQSRLHLVAISSDQNQINTLREALDARGLYGTRVTMHYVKPGQPLAYTNYMFNLIVDCDQQIKPEELAFTADTLKRYLRPGTGKLIELSNASAIVKREALKGAGEWTHMYANPANTVCSDDTQVGGALGLQWFGRPGPRQMIDRHHRTVAPLYKDGRLFIVGNDRVIAADAYNGTQLWNREFEGSRRIGAMSDASHLAVGEKHLYVAGKHQCYAVDPQTGKTQLTLKLPVESNDVEWGYVSTEGEVIYGSAVKANSSRRDLGYDAIREGAYFDGREVICSDALFSYSTDGNWRWTYEATQGSIMNPSITVGKDYVYFIQSNNKASLQTKTGRVPVKILFSEGISVVALHKKTGKVAWQKTLPQAKRIQHIAYLAYAQDMLFLVGSRNHEKKVWYDVYGMSAADGEVKWMKTQNNNMVTNGDHGEQDMHPVIVGDTIYTEPYAYQIKTGEPAVNWNWRAKKRRGCGNISASARTFFFRQQTASMYDLASGAYEPVTQITRPGCWINMIPAGGLLLVPESSSGCSCDFAIQTSLAFIPVEALEEAQKDKKTP